MCLIRFYEPLEWEVIYAWNEEEGMVEHSRVDVLKADINYDVDVYDTDGRAACLQFPTGEIVIAVPVTDFQIEKRCRHCDDPADPDNSRIGPLGGVPRYSSDLWAIEAELLRRKVAESRASF